MAEEIGFENERNSNFEGLVTLTLTLGPATRHTVVHHSSTSTYIPNVIEIEETFCGRTDGRTDVRTFPPSNIITSTVESRPKNAAKLNLKTEIGSVKVKAFDGVNYWKLFNNLLKDDVSREAATICHRALQIDL